MNLSRKRFVFRLKIDYMGGTDINAGIASGTGIHVD